MLEVVFTQQALLFTLPAVTGTTVFAGKLGLMALGGLGADLETDVDVDVDLDLGDGVEASDSTDAFNLLSVQSIAAFLMGFGWGGLGGLIGLDWPVTSSLMLAIACGGGMMWLLGLMLKAIHDLQQSGNIHIEDARGHEGTVYTTVPACGAGRGLVRVVIRDHSRIYDAVSTDDTLPSNARVKVLRVNADRTLVVAAV